MKRPIKHNIIIILTLFVVLFGISIFRTCSSKEGKTESGPEATLEAFYSNLCKGEFPQAAQMCDSLKMDGYIDAFRSTWEEADSTLRTIASDILSGMSVTVTDTEKNGQSRTIFYEISATDGRKKEKVATLRKEEGEWKIEEITDRH